MMDVYRWFILHDTSNKGQHVHQSFPDVRHYDDPEDEWLEVTCPMYTAESKTLASSPESFLTSETYEALLLTTYSTVSCIRYLLKTETFFFSL